MKKKENPCCYTKEDFLEKYNGNLTSQDEENLCLLFEKSKKGIGLPLYYKYRKKYYDTDAYFAGLGVSANKIVKLYATNGARTKVFPFGLAASRVLYKHRDKLRSLKEIKGKNLIIAKGGRKVRFAMSHDIKTGKAKIEDRDYMQWDQSEEAIQKTIDRLKDLPLMYTSYRKKMREYDAAQKEKSKEKKRTQSRKRKRDSNGTSESKQKAPKRAKKSRHVEAAPVAVTPQETMIAQIPIPKRVTRKLRLWKMAKKRQRVPPIPTVQSE